MNPITAQNPLARSLDVVTNNVQHLQQLFPEAFSEGKVDMDVLRELLGEAVDEREEKYGLNWHGKRRARQIALTPSTGTLRPVPEDSVEWENTGNLMLEGDNLEVLKLLQKSYAGQVKLIYIDPPYNTGKDFVYPDNFQDTIKNYHELTGQLDGGKKISSNTESSGRFHTDWLNMIYPRLKLARNLLREDGVIFISIDDNEIDNLRLVCDEIFGEENFIAQLTWEKGRKNDAKLFSSGHDYIAVYAKSKAHLSENNIRWREAKPGAAEIQEEYIRLKKLHGDAVEQIQKGLRQFYSELPRTHPSKKHSRYSNVDERGVWRDDNMSWPGGGGPTYDVPHPVTEEPCKVPEGGWRYSTYERMKEMIDSGRVLFRADHTEPPIKKTYLVRGEEESSETDEEDTEDVGIQVAGTYFYRSALQASNLMLELFGAKVFDSPKDYEVLSRWISYVCGSDKEAIIMDFFAGSGTTGHSVMAVNASDGGNRRYILVQLPEPLDPTNKDQKVAAAFCKKIGKPLTIAELTKERLRRSAEKVKTEKPDFSGDLGFRVYKLDSTNIRPWDPNPQDISGSLFAAQEHLKDGRTEQDILTELLLKLGLPLTVPIEERVFGTHTLYAVGAGTLMACLSPRIEKEEVEALAQGMVAWQKELAPVGDSQVVLRDSAFRTDVAKANFTAILEQAGFDKRNIRSL